MPENFDPAQIVPVATPMTAWIASVGSDELQSIKDLLVESYPVVAMQIDAISGGGGFLVACDGYVEPLRDVLGPRYDETTLLGIFPGSARPETFSTDLRNALLRLQSYMRLREQFAAERQHDAEVGKKLAEQRANAQGPS